MDLTTRPDIPNNELTLYVRKAIPMPTANSLKPLVMLEALHVPYSIHLIKSLPDETWYHQINPYKQLPAIEDTEVMLSAGGEEKRLNVFDSTAILLYLCEKYDKQGLFVGKDAVERAQVMSWVIAYAAGLGATGEWWLKLRNDPELAPALKVIETAIKREYDILEARLAEPGQKWVALADRPTIADLAIQPLANPRVAANAKIDFTKWPKLAAWSAAVDELEYVQKGTAKNNKLGMTDEEIEQYRR